MSRNDFFLQYVAFASDGLRFNIFVSKMPPGNPAAAFAAPPKRETEYKSSFSLENGKQ